MDAGVTLAEWTLSLVIGPLAPSGVGMGEEGSEGWEYGER